MTLKFAYIWLVQDYVFEVIAQGPAHALSRRDDQSADSQATSVISALGTVIGYVGAEVATPSVFERLVWPQRFYNNVSYHNILGVMLCMPMGGPLHKAALEVLDKCRTNGLFKGRFQGHALGTILFSDSGWRYKIASTAEGGVDSKDVRNGLWPRAVFQMSLNFKARARDAKEDVESKQSRKTTRALTTVTYLTLSSTKDHIESSRIVQNHIGNVRIRHLVGVVLSESTGIAMGAIVYGVWRSFWMFLWFIPLFLKLLSTAFAIPREDLTPPQVDASKPSKYIYTEIDDKTDGFLIIEGPQDVVLQFYRHYGHPIRTRLRENIQLAIVVAFGFLFPMELIISIVWLPVPLQYTWLGYKLYATIVMHLYRYSGGHDWATTEQWLARELDQETNKDGVVYLQAANGNTITAQSTRITVDSFGHGRKMINEYLTRMRQGDKSSVHI